MGLQVRAASGNVAASEAVAAVEPIWFAQEAEGLSDAAPLGNGRLGAIVHGGAWRERIVGSSLGGRSVVRKRWRKV